MENVPERKSFVRSDDVIGVKVINHSQEDLGEIYEIVIDKISGNVKYVVLDSGGFLGVGGKFFALPWQIFKYDSINAAFVINLSKEKLRDTPGFDKENWPTMSNIEWAKINDAYITTAEKLNASKY